MKKLIIATLVSGVMSSSALAVDAGKGTVTFTGSIIDAPCSIAPGDENQTVELGQISNVTLENGGASSAQSFKINLEGCNLNAKYTDSKGDEQTYNNTVDVTFAGTEWINGTTNTGLLQIIGDAKGAGIKLMNKSGAQININSAVNQNFVKGENALNFQAALQGVNGTTVTPGEFSAVTNFTLQYN